MAGAVLWPADASAQYRRGGHVYFRGGVYYRPYYYYPYWNWYGYGFGFGYPYAWGPYPYYGYPYYYGAYDYTGAARLDVKPPEDKPYGVRTFGVHSDWPGSGTQHSNGVSQSFRSGDNRWHTLRGRG